MDCANERTVHVMATHVAIDGALQPARLALECDDAGVHRVVDIADVTTASCDGEIVDGLVVPAMLDLHIHGAGGVVVPPVGDARTMDRAIQHQLDAPAIHRRDYGITSTVDWLATLPIPSVPPADPVEQIGAAARQLAGEATSCVGLRIEGLFINPEFAGVWPPETFCEPSILLLDELIDLCEHVGTPLRVIDVAPELSGAIALIKHAASRGVVVSLAHTNASFDDAMQAIDAGATLATHTWNAMRPIRHRDPGVIGAVITDPRVTCELICDGVHLHPAIVQLTVAAAGSGAWCAVSDASPFAGASPGAYDWAGLTVRHDGVSLRDSVGRLAGSASLLDRAQRVLLEAGLDPLDAAIALGATPRRVLQPKRSLGVHIGDAIRIVPVP
jgi:N-acetylglucosamine-6-phosphate deacetylase